MFVKLSGTAYQNGKTIGKYTKETLLLRVKLIEKIQSIKKLSINILNARVKDFTSLLLRISPHWLEEIKGQSDITGIEVNKLILLNCLPDGFYSDLPPNFYQDTCLNCSSFLLIRPKINILFKIRDEKNLPQSFFSLKSKGFLSSQAGRDIGNMGFAHFFNEKCLAGANNTGSFVKNVSDRPLLNDCHIMRYISERASCVDDIPPLIEKLIDEKVLGGANGKRGSIFLFTDTQKGLLIENDSQEYTSKFILEGSWVATNHFTTEEAKKWESKLPGDNTLIRRKRLKYLLEKNIDTLSPKVISSFTRDTETFPNSLCKNVRTNIFDTVSAQFQTIDKKNPMNSLNYACCSNPLYSFFIPISVSYADTYLPLFNGFFSTKNKEYLEDINNEKLLSQINKWEEDAFNLKKETSSLLKEAYKEIGELM